MLFSELLERRGDIGLFGFLKRFGGGVSVLQFSGAGERMALSAWLHANLSTSELDALRVMQGPLTMFRRGELLALMPFTFLR